MDSLQVRNTAEDCARVRIHDLHFRVVRDVEATHGSIKRDVVPVFFAAGRSAEFVFLQQVVAALRRTCEGKPAQEQDGTAHSKAEQIRKLHVETSARTFSRKASGPKHTLAAAMRA